MKIRILILILISLLICSCTCVPRHVAKSVLIEREVIDSKTEAFLKEMEKEEHFTGVALVMRKEEVVHAKGYGRANSERENLCGTMIWPW